MACPGGDTAAALARQATAGADVQRVFAARNKAVMARRDAAFRHAEASKASWEASDAHEAAEARSRIAALRQRLVLLLASEALAGGAGHADAAVAAGTAAAASVLKQSGRLTHQARWALGGAEPPSPRLTREAVASAAVALETNHGGEPPSCAAAAAKQQTGAGKSAGTKTRADLYADAKKHLARCNQLPEVDQMRVTNLGAFTVAPRSCRYTPL